MDCLSSFIPPADNGDKVVKEHQEEEGTLEPFLSKSSRLPVMDMNIADSLDKEDSLSNQEQGHTATSISEAYGLHTASVKVIGSYASNIFQDRQLLVAAEILTCLEVIVIVDNGLMPCSITQYISGALLMFISAERTSAFFACHRGELVAALKSDVVKVGMRDVQWRSPFH
ncbi:unnamed protein product [Sphagnum balticum]